MKFFDGITNAEFEMMNLYEVAILGNEVREVMNAQNWPEVDAKDKTLTVEQQKILDCYVNFFEAMKFNPTVNASMFYTFCCENARDANEKWTRKIGHIDVIGRKLRIAYTAIVDIEKELMEYSKNPLKFKEYRFDNKTGEIMNDDEVIHRLPVNRCELMDFMSYLTNDGREYKPELALDKLKTIINEWSV